MREVLSTVHGQLILRAYTPPDRSGSICFGKGRPLQSLVFPDQEYVMRAIRVWLGVAAVAGVFLLATVAQADDKEKDKKIPLDKVPRAITDAIKGRFPGAEVTSVEKEIEDGK